MRLRFSFSQQILRYHRAKSFLQWRVIHSTDVAKSIFSLQSYSSTLPHLQRRQLDQRSVTCPSRSLPDSYWYSRLNCVPGNGRQRMKASPKQIVPYKKSKITGGIANAGAEFKVDHRCVAWQWSGRPQCGYSSDKNRDGKILCEWLAGLPVANFRVSAQVVLLLQVAQSARS